MFLLYDSDEDAITKNINFACTHNARATYIPLVTYVHIHSYPTIAIVIQIVRYIWCFFFSAKLMYVLYVGVHTIMI